MTTAYDQAREDFRTVMNTKPGRAVLGMILEQSGYGNSVFCVGVEETMYKIGKHDFGVWLHSEMKAANAKNLFLIMSEMEKSNG